MASSLETRYKKAYEEFEKAAAAYYPVLQEHREALGKGKLLDTSGLESTSSKFYKTIQPERMLDQKLRDKLLRDIDKMPLPLDVRRIVKEYTGPLDTVRTEPPVPLAAQKLGIKGGRKTRKGGRRHKKTRRV
jgi:hypothetical protein